MKRIVSSLIFASLCLIGAAANAGMKTHTATIVNVNADGSGSASGSFSSAREDASGIVYIQCELYAASTSISCRARNSAGLSLSCFTSDPIYLNALHMLNDSAYLAFWRDTAGNCTNIMVRNGSNYMP